MLTPQLMDYTSFYIGFGLIILFLFGVITWLILDMVNDNKKKKK
jgi:hypothetical protein